MKQVKLTIFFLILVVLGTSSFQESYRVVRETPLKGYYRQTQVPDLKLFTWKRWFSAEFQEVFADRINNNTGFRISMIRINNQLDYSLFGVIHAKGFVTGKERYLFEEDYIHEYTGDYFIGEAPIKRKLSRLKNVMDSLRSYHVPLLLVFEPGKASFYPEYIPRRFHPESRGQSNYDYMVQYAREIGLPFIDLNRYFLQLKDTSRYPLFPRYGMHWSLFGVPFAVDTLSKSIVAATGGRIPNFTMLPLVKCSVPVGTDNDIGELLNLACDLPPTAGALPTIRFDGSVPRTVDALVIADSYYINIVEKYGRKMFRSQDYWYYNKKLYPYQNQEPTPVPDKTNLREKLTKYGVIILMASEINLHCGFWNFADEAFLAFHPEVKDSRLDGIADDIRNEREWFRFVVAKAKGQGKTVEEMVRADAEYTFYTNYDNLPGKAFQDSIQHLVIDIRSNAGWLDQVKQKATDRHISLDSMILLDAIYSYNESKKNR